MESALELIRYRRSIRAYTDQPLTRKEVEALIEAGLYAPSGHNKQSWLFTAVCNPQVLAELNERVRTAFQTLEPGSHDPQELYDAKNKVERLGENYHFAYRAPCLIIASNDAQNHNGRTDCACALENMFLTAYDLGLASCWVNQLHWLERVPSLRAYLEGLGIPLFHTISGSGVFGHPSCAIPKAPPRKENTWRIID